MLTDTKGNIIKSGDAIVVNLPGKFIECEVLGIKYGGMIVAHDARSNQSAVMGTQIEVKLVLTIPPNQPFLGAWKVVKPVAQ